MLESTTTAAVGMDFTGKINGLQEKLLKYSKRVIKNHIVTHSGHDLSDKEIIHLPVLASTRQCIAQKLLNGIPIDRILDGMYEAISITSLIIIYTHDRYP